MIGTIYTDSLTGLDNLFSLISCNPDEIGGKSGSVLFLDIKGLSKVNETYGKPTGDIYIEYLSSILKNEINSDPCLHDNTHVYRLAGDEFTILFRELHSIDLREMAQRVDGELASRMSLYGVGDCGVRFSFWEYSEPIPNISFLIKQSNKLLKRYSNENTSELPVWADQLIDRMYINVKETLEMLQETTASSLLDDVTMLPNSKSAKIHLKEELNNYKVKNLPFSILFIDGDNLKRYNELSYESGNNMIRKLGEILRNLIRNDDLLFRWLSGDEFIILLRNTSRESALRMAERIRSGVEQQTVSWEYPVTVSIGVSCYPEDGTELAEVISVAEKANFTAKKAGKNCIK